MNDGKAGEDRLRFLEQRVEHLEKINQEFRYAIDVVESFGELQRRIGTEHDLHVIQRESAKVVDELLHFETCGFFMLKEDLLGFHAAHVSRDDARDALTEEVDEQIESGTFSWVLRQLGGEVVPAETMPKGTKLLLHPLATESMVLGMFVATLGPGTDKPAQEVMGLLSVVLMGTALAMENAILYHDLNEHNMSLNDMVRERTAEIQQFLGMAAHDMRNPLSAIRGFAELLCDDATGAINDKQRQLVTTIHSTSDAMLHMVNDMLDMSVIESGQLNLEMAPSSLSGLVDEVVRLCSITADRKGILITYQQSPLPPAMVFDKQKIRQVIDNLISNAIKFSPADSNILVTAEESGGRVKVMVKDQGPGIPAEERDQLFKTFGKTSVRPTAGESSSGLGLAICKRIVTAHGGVIDVDCPATGGSEFVVTMKLECAEDSAAPGGASPAGRKDDGKVRILLADDEHHIRTMLGMAVRSIGFTVCAEAENGAQAVELFRRERPDMVLMDVNMPIKSGEDALSEILDEFPDTCILMLTSVSDAKTIKRCAEIGAWTWIRKDTPLQDIKSMVKNTWDDWKNEAA